jgi:hypothetical protein
MPGTALFLLRTDPIRSGLREVSAKTAEKTHPSSAPEYKIEMRSVEGIELSRDRVGPPLGLPAEILIESTWPDGFAVLYTYRKLVFKTVRGGIGRREEGDGTQKGSWQVPT